MYTIADAHCDTPRKLYELNASFLQDKTMYCRNRIQNYHAYVMFFAAWTEKERLSPFSFSEMLLNRAKNDGTSCGLIRILNAEDFRHCIADGKQGYVLCVEDARAIEHNMDNLDHLYKLGVRLITLVWNDDNDIACGAYTQKDFGLTEFGRSVVGYMQQHAMAVDLSHSSEKTFWDVCQISAAPPMVSHANCKNIMKHPRNISDEMIRELIVRKGFFGLTLYPPFVSENSTCDAQMVCEHILHVLSLGGEDICGIGTDFDGIDTTPVDVPHAEFLYRIFDFLKKQGVNDEIIEKISHKNLLNYMERIENP